MNVSNNITASACRNSEFEGNEAVHTSTCNELLYPVNKLPEKYRHIFSNYEYFNKIQTQAINTILYTDKSVVVSSPTGSGKTVIFELAIIRFLETVGKYSSDLENSKIIYVAPIKALCSERYEDWKNKFSINGLKCVVITGDTDLSDDVNVINSYNLIITTPEKWDLMTKKCKENIYKLNMVKLFLIDEVHLINEGTRGATLETIVSRMKIMPKIVNKKCNDFNLRFVAVSATVSNIEDIAKWLSSDQDFPAYYFKSHEDERPVKLRKIVLGYNSSFGGFKFDLDLTFKLKPLITQYSNGRPTLIFCSTRKSVEFTCSILVKNVITISECDDKQKTVNEFSKEINNNKIKELVKFGIGCHHAGMPFQERNVVENLFRMGYLNILVATSTLAMGVNLPAHLVIIKSTEYYNFNGYKEYDECQILQMIGRAGRPQFDTTATAIIMTKMSMKDRYEKILIGNQFVESHLHKHLTEHLNAEIFMGTIHDVTVAMDWIRSTFLYVRACKSPQNYGMMRNLSVSEIECRLQNLCLTEIKSLACTGLINFDNENNKITSNPEGEIMAKYSISFITMKSYIHLKGIENLNDMVRLLACSKEFEIIQLRRSEKVKLNILNKNKSPDANVIRFPIEEGINTRETKVNCLLQAILGTLKITDSSLAQDANKIILISIRLTKALREITFRGKKFEIARVACILAKCVSTRLWEQSKFVSKLIPRIGPVLSGDFVLNGKTTLQSIRDTDPRDLERFLNRHPPFGNYIHNFIRQIPKYKVRICFNEHLELFILEVTLIDHENISKNVRFHTVSILVGDSQNHILKIKKIRNEELLERGGIINMTISLKKMFFSDLPDYFITVCLISDQWSMYNAYISEHPNYVQYLKWVYPNPIRALKMDLPEWHAAFKIVGTDIEIKLKPKNDQEHIRESMSEKHYIAESPLKNIPSPRSIKKRTFKTAVNKQAKKEKIQINIKKYLHVSVEDLQDSKFVNKQHVEKYEDTKKYSANESSVATRIITGGKIKTQTNRQNNGHITEYFQLDKDNLNSYSSYDELINDDVFNDLFLPDDNSYDISKASDSAIEKYCFRENENQIKLLKDRISLEVIEPKRLKNVRDCFSVKKSEKTEEGSFIRALNKSSHTAHKSINQYIKDQLENKENVNPYKLTMSVQQEGFTNKLYQKSSTQSTNKSFVKKYLFTKNDCSKSVKSVCSTLSPKTPELHDLSDNIINCEPDITRVQDTANFQMENYKTYTSITATGSLSRQIEKNLKSSSDFYVSLENFTETVTTYNNGIKPITPTNYSSRVRPHGYSVKLSCTSQCRSGKATLDKYFRTTKTSQRLQSLNVNKLTIETKIDPAIYRRRLSAVEIDDNFGRRTPWPTPQPQYRTNLEGGKNIRSKKLFVRNLFNHGYDEVADLEEPRVATTTRQLL